MASISTARTSVERIALNRLWWLGPLAAGSAAGGTLLVRTIAVAFFGLPATLEALAPVRVAGASIAAVLAGALVFAALGRISQRPLRLFQRIAGVVLLLYSAVPVLALKLAPNAFPGIDVKAVWTMEVMHLVAGAITVGLFTWLAKVDTQATGGR